MTIIILIHRFSYPHVYRIQFSRSIIYDHVIIGYVCLFCHSVRFKRDSSSFPTPDKDARGKAQRDSEPSHDDVRNGELLRLGNVVVLVVVVHFVSLEVSPCFILVLVRVVVCHRPRPRHGCWCWWCWCFCCKTKAATECKGRRPPSTIRNGPNGSPHSPPFPLYCQL